MLHPLATCLRCLSFLAYTAPKKCSEVFLSNCDVISIWSIEKKKVPQNPKNRNIK